MSTPDIVILTGAGISAESGLGTFRDKDGLWTRYDLEDVATPEGFARNPALVHEFYNARRANMRAAEPNAAHQALARLEAARPGAVLIVTQNVDDLHQRAGSSAVIQMHGALDRALCADCGHRWPAPAVMAPAIIVIVVALGFVAMLAVAARVVAVIVAAIRVFTVALAFAVASTVVVGGERRHGKCGGRRDGESGECDRFHEGVLFGVWFVSRVPVVWVRGPYRVAHNRQLTSDVIER